MKQRNKKTVYEVKEETDYISQYEKAVNLTKEKVVIHEMINFDIQPQKPVKVSVVVPVCYVEQYLRECLDSIMGQTLREIEIICVNDGSSDSCMDILREYAQADTRIKVINKVNAGYGHTMNLGIDMAQGEYIGIVESDDFVVPEMYQELYDIATAHDLDLVKADFYRFYGKKGDYKLDYNKTAREDKNYNIVLNPSEHIECFRFIMNTWSGIYKKTFLREENIRHNETPGASFQDNGFWFKTFAQAKRVMFVNKPYYMNRRDNPNSSVYNPDKVYCGNEEYRYILEYIKQHPEFNKDILYIYSQKRYHTYLFTLNRIAPEFRKEYLHSFAEDFKQAEENGELKQSFFTKKEWETLHWIIRDPDEYYYNEFTKRVKVSVIIAIYNAEKYLKECIDTLLAQSLKEFEVICIDDGSSDNSYSMLYEYSMKDRRIKVFRQENKGAGAARNYGLTLAQGEYVLFVDGDDYFDKEMLKESYRKSVQDNSDICIFKSKQFDMETGKISDCTFSLRTNELPAKRPFSVSDLTSSPFHVFMGWAWDKLYRKSFILNNRLYFQEQRTTNDMYFVFASIFRAGKITTVEKALYYQRRNVPGSLSATRALSWECFYHALKKVKDELNDMGIYETYQQDYINYALHSCLWNLNTLPHEQALLLFDKLKTEWFAELGIEDYGKDYYKNKTEYDQFLDILKAAEDGGEPSGYWSYSIYRMKRENKALKEEIQKLKNTKKTFKISEKETLTEEQLIEKLQWNRKKREELEQVIKCNKIKDFENVSKKNKELEVDNRILNDKLNNFQILVSDKESLSVEQCIEKLLWNREQKSKYQKLSQELERELKDKNVQITEIKKSVAFKLGLLITWLPRKIKSIVRK